MCLDRKALVHPMLKGRCEEGEDEEKGERSKVEEHSKVSSRKAFPSSSAVDKNHAIQQFSKRKIRKRLPVQGKIMHLLNVLY